MSTEQARAGRTALASPIATLHGRRLGIARAVWAALFALSLGAYVLAIPAIYESALMVCQGPDCAQWRLSVAGASALRDAGLSVELYAALTLALRVLSASVFFVVAAMIFRRRSEEWLPLLLSFFLVLQAPGSDVGALGLALPQLAPVGTLMEYLATALLVPLFYLFPDGRWVPHWSRIGALFWVVLQFFYYFLPGSPLDGDSWPPLLQGILFVGCLGSAVFAQGYRYRRVSGPVERQQTKWVIFGLTIAILGSALLALIEAAPAPVLVRELAGTLVDPFFLVLPLSVGIAILRYRLWDIDVIINRALVYGALTGIVVGLYVLVVGGLGALLQARGNPIISLVATGLIAVLFQPLLDRLQQTANRVMYGERDEPYAVLSRLGQRLEGTLAPAEVLPTVARTVREALRLPYAAIELWQDGAYSVVASAGQPANDSLRLPLVYRGEQVGQLVLAPRVGEDSFSASDRRLLEDLARQAGVAAHAVRLTTDLQRSRERLVTAREEERRRLRRDLHDGLGPTLASLFQRLDTASALVSSNPEGAVELIGDLKGRVKTTIADIRRLVYALRPPALDEFGLVGAIREHAGQINGSGGLRVAVDAPETLAPLPAAAEVAAYRIAIEALANVVRHAQATVCRVRVTLDSDVLQIEVADDGVGLPPGHRAGVGIASMRERAAELGGELHIEQGDAGGTHVSARLPLRKG